MNKKTLSTPILDGFRMPGEHESQEQVWMAWPVRPDNWRNQGLPAQKAFVAVASTIAKTTPVTVLAAPIDEQQARQAMPDHIRVLPIPSDDIWMRDIGATYVVSNESADQRARRAINWQFNAWGGELDGLYDDWSQDNAVASKMAEATGDKIYNAPFILEGGAIHVDGEGTLFTTEECLLHPSRNPNLTKTQIEQLLKNYLNVDTIIWLKQGLFNDETNGHIDNIMHVVRPGVVALTYCENPSDPQYAISQAAYKQLSETTDAKGRKLQIIKLPMPGPLFISPEEAETIENNGRMQRQAGERLAASYANFLISNNQVIFPLLDEATDEEAYKRFIEAFPNHEVTGIPARDILLGGGNIHCITQQVPAK